MNHFAPPPLLQDFSKPVDFFRARIAYRRKTEQGFSIARECLQLRRCSSALVSMILKNQRPLSIERSDDLAKIMGLQARERAAFKDWLLTLSPRQPKVEGSNTPSSGGLATGQLRRREVSHHLLSDWLHPYVKDAFRFEFLQRDPNKVVRFFASLAAPDRIRKSLKFLLREGYLRRTLDGRIVEDVPLTLSNTNIASDKIRNFHKKALQISLSALELYSPQKRLANTMVLPLSKDSHEEVLALIEEFASKLQKFAENDTTTPEEMFQLVINLSPIGYAKDDSHE